MQASRRRIEELLWILGLNKITAPVWERLRGARAVQQSQLMRQFYAPLLPKDALVFDIGANVGTMTQVFTSLGAKVIAVEPNPDCVRHIELATSRNSVEVLQAAVGEKNGLALLKVSDRKDKMSSLSDAWREAITKENQDYAGMWKRELTVPLITLDALIARYGMPHYIKIDVEGYEDQALKGLSRLPPLLSFEFNRLFLNPILQLLGNPVFANSSCNYTLVDPVRFELRDWVSADNLISALRNLADSSGLGDIFVRDSASV